MNSTFTQIKKLFNIKENSGYTPEEIQKYKNIFGTIPKILEEYYLELGKNLRLNHTQDSLVTPENCEQHNITQKEYFIFYHENQYACVWGIRKEDLQLDNPPVYMNYDPRDRQWKKETDTLSDFLLIMAYSQAIFALENTIEEFVFVEEEQELNFIPQNYPNLGLKFKEWLGVDFYTPHPDSVIAVMKESYCLTYASDSKSHFEEIDQQIEKYYEGKN